MSHWINILNVWLIYENLWNFRVKKGPQFLIPRRVLKKMQILIKISSWNITYETLIPSSFETVPYQIPHFNQSSMHHPTTVWHPDGVCCIAQQHQQGYGSKFNQRCINRSKAATMNPITSICTSNSKNNPKKAPWERTPVWLSVCPRAGVVSLNFPIYDSWAEGRGPISAYRRFSKCILGYGFYCFIAIPRTNHPLPSLPLAVSLKS